MTDVPAPPYEPNQIMLDLETLDTAPSAIILSIGMVRFDPALHDPIGEAHYVVLSVGDQEENARTVSERTMTWWAEQSDEARTVLEQSTAAEHDVHEQLIRTTEWMGVKPVVWGNGSDFDNVLLASLYATYELKQPWSHQDNRCYRTLCAIATRRIAMLSARSLQRLSKPPEMKGTKHNALDDAIYQARVASRYLRLL